VTDRNRDGVMVIHGTVWAIPHVLLPCASSSSTVLQVAASEQVPPDPELIDFLRDVVSLQLVRYGSRTGTVAAI
jgi:hypothetical protein